MVVLPHTPWTRLRTVVNWINLSTVLGLLVARFGGATRHRRGRGTVVCVGYRYGFPVASAFTIGNVIITKHDLDWMEDRPVLLQHEDRHCTQYAFLVGPVMLPLYFLSVGISYALAGDHSSFNPFERLAGLADGGYPPATTRFARRRSSQG
ncbi:hypothetical protein [Aeromicrobium sp.]|uniref:hypothetical protein n=1 Tax=Aeromicrobium sp. TaxID=1871063 RepID=UPI003C4C9601